MKAKALLVFVGIVITVIILAAVYQWNRYKEAVRSLAITQTMIPGRTQAAEVKEAVGNNFFESGNCPSGTCAFTRSFENMWLERLALRKSLIFVVDVSVEKGLVTHTSASLKILRHGSWVGAAVLRLQNTACKTPDSSCIFVNVADDPRIPIRVVSELPPDPVAEVKSSAYNFDLKCLLLFRRCAKIDDIYPEWRHLRDLTDSN